MIGDAPLKTHYTFEACEERVRNAREGERYEYHNHNGMVSFLEQYTTLPHHQVVQNAADVLKAYCRVYTEKPLPLPIRTSGFPSPNCIVL